MSGIRKLADKSEKSNNFAISSSGIGEALQRSASALATAGNSIEESIGLIVAANDVVQNPESVGTAMKTLAMYMRTMRTEAEEAGISTDGMAESTAKLRDELLALTGGQLDIQIDDTHLKSTFQVLQELSEIWDDIGKVSENNQARILEMLGGKRNANVLSSIITNFEDAIAAMKTAGDSAGSAWIENEKYLTSIEGKTKQVQAAFEAFANSVINSDIVKTWLDIGKGILNAGSALNEVGALLPTIAAGLTVIKGIIDSIKASTAANQIMTYLNAGNAANSDAIQGVIANLTKGQQKALAINIGNLIQTNGATQGLQDVANLLQRNVGVTNTLKSTFISMGTTVKTVISGIKASLMSAGIAALISLAISGIAKLVQWISTAKERAIEAAQEVNQAYTDQAKSTSDNISSLKKLEKEYNELNAKAGANGTQGSLNADEFERYKKVISEIASISPGVVAGFTEEGAALKDYNGVIQDAIGYQEQLLTNQKRILVNDADTVYSGARAQISDLYDDMKKYTYQIYDAFSPTHGNILGNNGVQEAKNWLDILDTVGIKLDEIVEKTGNTNVEYHTSRISDVWLRSYDYLEQLADKQEEIRIAMLASDNYTTDQVSDVVNKIANLGKILPQYESYVKSVQNVLLAYADTDAGLLSTLNRDELNVKQLDAYYKGIKQIADANKTFAEQKEAVKEYTRLFADMYADIDRAQSQSTLDGVWTVWGELQEKYKDSPYLLGLIKDALFGVTEAENQNAEATENAVQSYEKLEKILGKISNFNSFLNKARNGSDDPFGMISSAKDLAEAYNEIAGLTGDNAIDWTSMTSGTGANGEILWDTKQIEDYIKAMIDASVSNTEFANSHPEVIAWLQDMAISFENTAESVKTLSDAMANIDAAFSYNEMFEKYSKGEASFKDMFEEAISYAQKTGTALSTLFVMDEGGNVADFTALTEARLDALIETAYNMDPAFKNAGMTLDEFKAAMKRAADESDKSAKDITDALNDISTGFDYRALFGKYQDGKATFSDMFSEALKLVETGAVGFGEIFKIGENGVVDFVDITETNLDKLIEAAYNLYPALSEAGISLDDFKTRMREVAEETDKSAKTISDALSDINSAFSYNEMFAKYSKGEASFKDMFEEAISYAEKTGTALSTLFTVDKGGNVADFTALTEARLNALIDTAYNMDPAFKDAGMTLEEFRTAMKQAAEETDKSAKTISDALNDISTGFSYKELFGKYQKGEASFRDMFEETLKLVETGAVNFNDVFKMDSSGRVDFVDITEQSLDKLIETAYNMYPALVEAGIGLDEFKLRMREVAEEADNTSKTLSDALSDIDAALSYNEMFEKYSNGEASFKDMFEEAISYAEKTGTALSTLFVMDEGGNVADFTALTEARLDSLIETAYNMDPAFKNAGMTLDEFKEAMKRAADEGDGLKGTLSDLSALVDFESKIGQSVDFDTVFDDLESLKEKLGDDTLQLTDIIKWEDGDFKYIFNKTDLLSGKIDEFANQIVAYMGLAGDEATAAAEKIKASLAGITGEYDALNTVVSKVKAARTFSEAIESFQSGDTGLLDILSEASTIAETLGIKVEDVFDFTTLQPSMEAVNVAINAAVDKWAEGKDYSEELVQQLKDAAKAEQEILSKQQKINDAYEKSTTAASGASNYNRDTQLTYEQYKSLIEVDSRYASTIEYVNGQLTINKQKYWEVTQAINEETIAMAKLAAQQDELEIEKLTKQLSEMADQNSDEAKSIRSKIQQLQLEANGYKLLAQELDNATDAFARFAAASDSTEGSMHSAAQEAYNIINDTLYNKDSDRYGMVGNEKYKAAIDLVIGDVDESSYDAAMAKLKRYFEDDKAGVKNFYTDLVNSGIIDATTGAFDTTITEISQKLGITEEAARSMMQQLEQYSKEGFDWEKLDPGSTLEDATTETKTLGEQLDETKQKAEDAATAVNTLNETKADLNDEAAQTDVKTLAEGIQNCIDLITTLNGKAASINTTPAQTALGKLIGSINNVINKLTELNGKSVTVTVNKVEKSSGGDDGDGEAGGSFVKESWGFADARGSFRSSGGRTLVGELGRELVVDVAKNRWYTVGDNGAEFVNLPKNAIVFNHLQTAQLLGDAISKKRGSSFASGTALSKGDKVGGTVFIPEDLGDDVTHGSQTVSDAADEVTDALEEMKNALDEANGLMEHYIAHIEQDYYVHERASDYNSMQSDLMSKAEYYRKIYEQSMQAVRDMRAAGATESDEELQEAEEAAWEAYQNMYDTLDEMRDLIKDALSDAIDDLQSAYDNMKDAVDEYNDTGHISIDTFQDLVDGGIQYLSYLVNENGQLEINTESLEAYLQARKNQYAIESALSYLSRIREAAQQGEVETMQSLIDATNTLCTATWGSVYQQIDAMLAAGEISQEQYDQIRQNIENLQALAAAASDDLGGDSVAAAVSKIKDKYEELNEQIEHYIKHLEHAQDVADRYGNLHNSENAIIAQIQEYQRIIEQCRQAIAEMEAEGADDTNEDLQAMEEQVWSAQQSIWNLYDSLYSLRTDALRDRLSSITSAVSDFQSAIEEINDTNHISLDTFESILSNGLQYLQFLNIENGQLSINQQAVEEMTRARKEQLAVETAMSYLNQIEEALLAGEADKVAQLVGLTDQLSESTWAAVYAKLALLKTEGLSDEDAARIEEYLEKLKQLSAMVDTDIAAPAVETVEDRLGAIKDEFDEIQEDIEHFIKHCEQAVTEATRAMDFGGITNSYNQEIIYYQRLMNEAESTLARMRAEGADDTDEHLQAVEEAYWDAYNSIMDITDKLNALRVDQLSTQLDELTTAYNNLHSVVEEFNENGKITLSTFESLLDGGLQYLTFLEKEGDGYAINVDKLQDYVSARKEQLAVETALSYINQIKEALEKGESYRLDYLIDATNEITDSTWSYVYAQAAALKMAGLTDDQYNQLIENLDKLKELSRDVETDLTAGSEDADRVKELADAFDELNDQIEHYIKHVEQAYKEAERAWDFESMEDALEAQIGYYSQIMAEAQETINKMRREGADDTNEDLQKMEETYWSAYNAVSEIADKIRSIRVEALKKEIDALSSAFSSFKDAADEYNKTGGISVDTFQSIVDGGMQYLSLLEEQDGQLVLNNEKLQEYIQTRKEQLAIETAMNYVSELKEALQNGERERVDKLIDATNGLSSSTWGLVYANAAALKAAGLSNEQYEEVLANIAKLRALAQSVNTDLTESGDDLTSKYKAQSDALDQILKYTEDLIKAEAKDRVNAIKDEIDAYQEIIKLKKEALDTTKEEADYEKNVADKVKEIAKLQAKADLLALDTSRSAAAERQSIMEEILEKQQELADVQGEYALDAQKEALDKEAEEYEKVREAEIEEIEASVSSTEKVYQLAMERIRTSWDTLYDDLIAWNTEQGTVINQEITDAWEDACDAVKRYGDYVSALAGIQADLNGTNANGQIVVADLPKYHGGGVTGEKGKINDDEVLAILERGELVVDKIQKGGLYTIVDFVKSLGERLGTTIGNLRNLRPVDSMVPAFAGMAEPSAPSVTENNNMVFNPTFYMTFSGADIDTRNAREYGRELGESAASSLFDAFNRRGINIVQTLRQ